MSHADISDKYDKDNGNGYGDKFTLKDDFTIFASFKGNWTSNYYFDDELIWDYEDYKHFDLLRMAYTLPSDSTCREDLVLLRNGDEEKAGEAKIKLEEIQRRDRKLRQKNK